MNRPDTRVLIRADAGAGVGLGHLVRCLAIAEQLVRLGARVTFATHLPNTETEARVRRAGADLRVLGEGVPARGITPQEDQLQDAQEALGADEKWDAVVVDHYGLDATWEGEARRSAARVVAIDDLANRSHDADVIVDHNWYGAGTANRYRGRVRADALQLLGPRYALLDRAYADRRGARDAVRTPPRRVLIGFGGTDAGAQTESALRAVLERTELHADVVMGSRTRVTEELRALVEGSPRAELHIAVPHLADLLSRADLAIGASGSATWERLCLGVPSIVTTVSEAQSGVTRALADSGACTWLGIAPDVGPADYADALAAATAGALSAPPAIVDGFGSARVALAILGALPGEITRRDARDSDDASVASSFAGVDPDAGPAQWRLALDVFREALVLARPPAVLEIGGVPVGAERTGPDGTVERAVDGYLVEGMRR